MSETTDPQRGVTWRLPAHESAVVATLLDRAREIFGREPDGVWMAPGRVNLIGEHTDYNDGFCLPFALPHRTYAAIARRSDGVLRLASLQKESSGWEGPVDEIRPGEPEGWPAYVAGVAAALVADRRGAADLGADVLVDGHVPLGAGLSSSAALSCSFAVGLRELVPTLAHVDDAALAAACVRAENDYAGAATGGMDQTVSVRAVDEHLLLIDARDFSLTPVAWTLPEHEVLVIDTRAHHSLADGQYAARRQTCQRACGVLGVDSLRDLGVEDVDGLADTLGEDEEAIRRVRHVLTENARVLDLVAALREQEAERVGELMTASHVSLRDDYEVSCRELDVAVDAALAAGALGARMTGGGFGGSAIALVRREDVAQVAVAVAAAFADAGLDEPHFLAAAPDRPAGRVSAGG